MIICIHHLLHCKDWLILFLGSAVAGIIPILFYTLKPALEIDKIERGVQEFDNIQVQLLKINIKNTGVFLKGVNAVNLKIEACILQGGNTFHLALDKDDFLILPPKCKNPAATFHERVFKSREFNIETRDYYDVHLSVFLNDPRTFQVRVRIHATHEYSGFGKAFEQIKCV